MKKKIAVAVSLLLVLALSVGGTIAWLTVKTDSITNTFTIGKVDIMLIEPGGDAIDYEYSMVPGDTYPKDPGVVVAKGSEKSYVFVTIAETNNTITVEDHPESIVQWTIADGWIPLPTDSGATVYYQTVEQPTADGGTYLQVFAGDDSKVALSLGLVTINENLTMGDVTDTTKPTIKIQAAAIQYANIDGVYEAWDNLPKDFTNGIIVTTPVTP